MRPPNLLAIEHLSRVGARARMIRARLRQAALRFWDWASYPLRPKHLQHRGHSVRWRWYVNAQAIYAIDPAVEPMLDAARKIIEANFYGGRNDPEFMRGKRIAEHARGLEDRMVILAAEAGPQYVDGTSSVNLMGIARRVR